MYLVPSPVWVSIRVSASDSSCSSVFPNSAATIANCIEMRFHPTSGFRVAPHSIPSKVSGHSPLNFFKGSLTDLPDFLFATAFSTVSLDLAYNKPRSALNFGGSIEIEFLGLLHISAYNSGVILVASALVSCTLYLPLSLLFTLGHLHCLPRLPE